MKKFSLVVAGVIVALTALPSLADEGTAAPLRTRRTDLLQRDVPAPTAPVVVTATVPVLDRTAALANERIVPPQAEPAPLPVPAAEIAPPERDLTLQLGSVVEISGLVLRDQRLVAGQTTAEVQAIIRQETAALVCRDLPVTQR